jgi:outer membrane protein assembly factor BamB
MSSVSHASSICIDDAILSSLPSAVTVLVSRGEMCLNFTHRVATQKMKLSAVLLCFLSVPLSSSLTLAKENWPAWRGDVAGSGEVSPSPAASLPVKWDKETNIKWRTELPERGNSTPVIWGDRIFLTQAEEAKNWRGLLCIDRNTGTELWRQGVNYEKDERTHRSNPYCSASAATDGEIVVASYGSAGLVAYDLQGKQLWQRDFGAIDHVWGNSTSPVIHGDLVIHYHGPAKDAVLYGLDKTTGETLWKYAEPQWQPGERTDGFKGRSDEGIIGSFSTPIIYRSGDRDELVMSFPMEIRAFDPTNGETLWNCQGLNPLVYTSPAYDAENGIVVAMGGYQGNSIAVRTGGSGNVTETHRLWQKVRDAGGIGSGVVKDGKHYYHNSGGVVFCVDMKTGEEHWKARLPGAGKSWGSLVLAGDRIYSLSQNGDSAIFAANPERFEEVGHNELGEETNSSIAVVSGQLFIRTYDALWCIEAP